MIFDRLRIVFFLLAFGFVLILVGVPHCLLAKSPPVQSVELPVPAQGLSVSLWAGDNMLSNPTGMAIDSRGRIWIAEGLNYRLWAKQNSQFKRVPQADRIKILEDTNHDGKADKVTVFAENIFPMPQGLAIQEIWDEGKIVGTKVYVGSGSDLLVIEDTNGDDKADKRSVLLTGFRGVDSDHGLHGMTLGPDGKLYFTVGDGRYGTDRKERAKGFTFDVTDKSGRRLQNNKDGTTLRVNRNGTQFELLSTGQRNNYETSVNSFGNVFTSDNDDDGNRGCRMIWVMNGAHYGYKNPNSNHHWAEELPGNVPKLVGTGNGAPSGILVYEGDIFPKQYHGAVIQVDAGTHQVNVHPLERQGAAFRSDYQVLLKGNDEKFRPVDAAVAPDGSVYVCDWYDSSVGGNRFTDQSSGRVYRVFPKNAKLKKTGSQFDTVAHLIEALKSCNLTTRVAARDVLVQKKATARDAVMQLFKQGKLHERARALYVLSELPQTGQKDVIAALKDAAPQIRELAIRILANDASRNGVVSPESAKSPPPAAAVLLDELLPLVNDTDAGVRRELILALRYVKDTRAKNAIKQLAFFAKGNDRYYLEAVRLAMKDWESKSIGKFFDELAQFTQQKRRSSFTAKTELTLPPYVPVSTNDAFRHIGDPLPKEQIDDAFQVQRLIGLAWVLERSEAIPALKKLLGRYSRPDVIRGVDIVLERMANPHAATLLTEQFAQVKSNERRRAILRLLGRHLGQKWKEVRDEKEMASVFKLAMNNEDLRVQAIKTIAACRAQGFDSQLMKLAVDEKQELSTRIAAMEALGRLKYQPATKIAAKIVQEVKGKQHAGAFAQSALLVMLNLGGKKAASQVQKIITDKQYPFDFRKRALQVTIMNYQGAKQVLALARNKKLSATLFSESQFLLHHHPDRRIRLLALKELPLPKSSKGKPLPDINDILALTGNVKSGEGIFHSTQKLACASCHRVQGKGHWVGPDLSSIGTKYGKRELLFHIFNPSSAINYNYVTYSIVTENGLVLNGLIADENQDRIILKTALGERIEIAKTDIDFKKAENLSIMPDNLVDTMTTQNLSDLVAYLSTLRKPVSAARRFYVLGPFAKNSVKLPSKINIKQKIKTTTGTHLQWQAIQTGRDNHLDLSSLLGTKPGKELICLLSVSVSKKQLAKLVIVSFNEIRTLQINGKNVTPTEKTKRSQHIQTSTYEVELSSGSNHLAVKLASGAEKAGLMATLISEGNETIRFDKK
ncbi:hypothetical protein MNBD_PLANCTO02-3218 [hydrothermal vent metagenome]|uniref:Cytochrome c domain-containing protein n=1 Tax=hydrothermal vent metagenome TaxID=652676 RepID=A0A3B1E8D5_9ZZZZ